MQVRKSPLQGENPLFLLSGLPALLRPVLCLHLLSIQTIVSVFTEGLARPLPEVEME